MGGQVGKAWSALGMLALLSGGACSGGSFSLADAGAAGDGEGPPPEAGNDAATTVAADQACIDLATSACTRFTQCASIFVTLTFGDAPTCVARTKLACTESMSSQRSGFTPASTEQCAQAYTTAACEEVLSGQLPAACMIHGSAGLGGACGDGSDCPAGTFCSRPSPGTCGICTPLRGDGGACQTSGECQSGLTCAIPAGAAAGACVAPGSAGDGCDAQHPCLATLVCNSAGTCAKPLGAGASCKGQDCDTLRGLYCNPLTHVCAQTQTADAGAPCGASLTTGVLTACAAAGRCKLASSGPSTMGTATMGTCQAAAADGAKCDPANGPNCLSPAACVNGACTLPAPASCL